LHRRAALSLGAGVACNTQKQVQEFLAFNDADPQTTVRAVNDEERDPTAFSQNLSGPWSAAMSFATLMVHMDVEAKSDARVRLAAQLADRFASALIGISACVLPPYPAEGAYFVTREFVEQEREATAAAFQRTEAAFRAAAGEKGSKLKWLEWRSAIDLPETFIVSEARAADLVIVGRAPSPMDIRRCLDPAAAVLRAGRAMLVVPPGVDTLKAERILIGWKDAREARRALRDSLPLLHEAKSATIVEVCDDSMAASARQRVADVASYLARHRMAVGSARAAAAKNDVAHRLIDLARVEGADLIVTGAYGHSRLGEWIFGGVTRELLGSSPVCCLMSN
jgi:nucleotide-binding universal stress UspA family protein